jgi:glycosyltransferase involved in cell wall biosynthesis
VTTPGQIAEQTRTVGVELELVLPVHNEAHVLDRSVRQLHDHLAGWPSWRITIVDNASTDETWSEAGRLVAELPGVGAIQAQGKGRGLALRTAWSRSDARIVAYTDIDLSTNLRALVELVTPLSGDECDIAIGSRLAPESRIVRGVKREFISRCYNRLLHAVLQTTFRDAQCGFKALRADVAKALLEHVESDQWFFDTELLLLAERNGLRIHEVPVDWVDDPDSRVRIVRTAMEDLHGVVRMRMRFWRGNGRIADLPGRPGTDGGSAVRCRRDSQ